MVSKCLVEINAIFRMLLMLKEQGPDEGTISSQIISDGHHWHFLRLRVYWSGKKKSLNVCIKPGVMTNDF